MTTAEAWRAWWATIGSGIRATGGFHRSIAEPAWLAGHATGDASGAERGAREARERIRGMVAPVLKDIATAHYGMGHSDECPGRHCETGDCDATTKAKCDAAHGEDGADICECCVRSLDLAAKALAAIDAAQPVPSRDDTGLAAALLPLLRDGSDLATALGLIAAWRDGRAIDADPTSGGGAT